ncbi:hypothetical protein Cgig2_021095 [Carnegiea gigantea]|uniref:Uncharacterized protein n=1 Tax=Carnegiea gigantea TaxID=171969 RepID=A0A9Q1QAY9_9CARY|nr:hypothetical protein Cgig2_021095 [Carnegiea gigantea]
MDGTIDNERAPLQDRQECGYGPYYQRSSSLQSFNVIPSSTLTSILVKKVRVKQGTLPYRRNDENKCVDVSKNYENYFNVVVLEKVNTKRRGPKIYPDEEEFYPALHRLAYLVSLVYLNFHTILTQMYGEPVLSFGEFSPLNKDLADHNKYPTTVIELLRIHAKLFKFHNVGYIYYDLWLDHFYREYLVYFAYGKQMDSKKGKVEAKKRSP